MGLTNYLKETKSELKHVAWPSRQQTINFTLVVIGVSVLVAAILGLIDLGLAYGLEQLI